jgi:ribosome maturation factor RimP
MKWEFVQETPLTRRIRELAEPVCASCGVDLYLVEAWPNRPHSLVRVLIDAIGGVTIDDCTNVSRKLSAVLDVEDPLPGSYRLEVSSPGIERPLRGLDDARRHVGQRIHVETNAPVQNRRRFTGNLQEVESSALVVEVDGTAYRLPADQVRKAHLVHDFQPPSR